MKKLLLSPLKLIAFLLVLAFDVALIAFFVEKLIFGSFFFEGAKQEMRTPGTWTNYVQQGFDRLDDGKFLVSTYNKDDDSAAIFVMENDDETLCKLKNQDGTPYLSHAGGVTHYQQWVYVATDTHVDVAGETYCTHETCDTSLGMFLLSDVLDGDGQAMLVDSITVPNRSAYTSVYDNRLFVGAFQREGTKYITPENHHVTTPAGDKNTALMMVYELDETTGKPVHATPEYCYSTLPNVQGMCMTGDGDIVLSTSWGLNASYLYQYNPDNATVSMTIVNGVAVPLYHLDSACLIEDFKTPPMAEELVWLDGRVYILTESASMKYIYGKVMSGNHVYSYPIS